MNDSDLAQSRTKMKRHAISQLPWYGVVEMEDEINPNDSVALAE